VGGWSCWQRVSRERHESEAEEFSWILWGNALNRTMHTALDRPGAVVNEMHHLFFDCYLWVALRLSHCCVVMAPPVYVLLKLNYACLAASLSCLFVGRYMSE
jgi:hypothetical protein